jgi:hypothetical protein
LGWLSVDADECPPHVFGVTEADRLRDAFDRLGRRLYAASGQIDAEPFHHTRGRGARLRPECAAELAQAHADLVRQALDGEPFGDVIASIPNGRGNPVVLGRQIDGRGELRLSAMAAMVDDEVLGHAFGDGKAVVLLDQSQREIDPGRDARRSPYVAVPTEDAVCLNPDGWVLSLQARCMSPVCRRSAPVQQSSRREGECTGADAHHAPASAGCLHNTAQRASGLERIDPSAGDDERIEHGIMSAYPRLDMKNMLTTRLCSIAQNHPNTTRDNFIADFGIKYIPGYTRLSSVDFLHQAPFAE